MRKLFLILFGLMLLGSCSPKITMTTLDGSKSKTVKYKGEVKIDQERLYFTTRKGTKQAPLLEQYNYEIEK